MSVSNTSFMIYASVILNCPLVSE